MILELNQGLEHFSSLVDVVGRHGHLEDADEIRMIMYTNSVEEKRG